MTYSCHGGPALWPYADVADLALLGEVRDHPSLDDRARTTVESLVVIVLREAPLDEAFKSIIRTTSMRRDVVDAAVRLCETDETHDGQILRRVRHILVLAKRSLFRHMSMN
jgi:hypothetical protein